jgi:hypothetical protein
MRSPAVALLAALLLQQAAAAADVDLTKIDRRIVKEPVYQSKSPKYCLLAFGREAETRIWLVLDGKVAYLDRNGDGDLTAADEKVQADKIDEREAARPAEFNYQEYKLGKITAKHGVAPKTELHLMINKENLYLAAEAEGVPWQRAGSDASGTLRLADSARSAPVVHFQGPLSIQPDEKYTLQRGEKGTEFYAFLGTRGHGPGTFACIGYSDVPRDKHPVAEFRFPARSRNSDPIVVKVPLKQRC